MKYHARDYFAVLGSHAALLLFGLLVFPFFGMDALAVWESVREGVSNGVHALLGILYA